MNWTAWVHGPGLPPVALDFMTPELMESHALANQYLELAGNSTPSNFADYKNWTSNLKVVFLSKLEAEFNNLTVDIITRID